MKNRKGGNIDNNRSVSIGIIYSLITTIIGTIFCIFIIFVGIWVKNLNSDKSSYTIGLVKDVSDCDYKTKTCISTIQYVVKNKEYTVKSSTGLGNKGQTIGIYYDPENPNNFKTNNYSTLIGWVMIIISCIIILSIWLWFIFTLIFKPVVVSDIGVVKNI